MKLVVIDCSKQTPIADYAVEDISMLDFLDWENSIEVTIDLDKLLQTVSNLDSNDPETQKPVSSPKEVELFLPKPIKDLMLCNVANAKAAIDGSADQFSDRANEVAEKMSTPDLKSSTIMCAVVTEILQNHLPHHGYKVRISDE